MSEPNTSYHYDRVVEFHKLAGQPVRTKPHLPNEEERLLRARLILEEAFETVEALGVSAHIHTTKRMSDEIEKIPIDFDWLTLEADQKASLVEIADGIADLRVVCTGTLIHCGLRNDNLLQKLVDENNLKKFGPGGYKRADGKWMKPPSHQPPNIEGFLHDALD